MRLTNDGEHQQRMWPQLHGHCSGYSLVLPESGRGRRRVRVVVTMLPVGLRSCADVLCGTGCTRPKSLVGNRGGVEKSAWRGVERDLTCLAQTVADENVCRSRPLVDFLPSSSLARAGGRNPAFGRRTEQKD
jgi:hypothetical protein